MPPQDVSELARKAEFRSLAPTMPEEICDQLAALHPVQVVPKSEHVYLDRMTVAGSFYQDEQTGVRHIVLVWPNGGAAPVLRLYIDLPTGEAFLIERSMKEAVPILSVTPPLPRRIRLDAEAYIRRYIPLADMAADMA